jgi:hypothetical protein
MRGMEPMDEPRPSRAEALRERHERLCFARAFPRSASELRRAERELAGFERRVRGVREELDNSGIAGTLCRYPYNHAMATWLARRYGPAVTVDWKEYKRQPWDEVASLLSLVVAEAESEGLDDEDTGSWDWVAHARGRTSDLQWLLARLRGQGLPPALERHLYEALSLPLAWDLSGCRDAVTHARLPVRNVFYHPGPLLGRPADFLAEVRGPAGDLELLPPGRADRAIDAARAALSQREREFHVIVHANRDETYRFEAGRGLEIYLFGLVTPLRLTLEADYGALLVKNGVPVGYGYAALLFDRADLGINVFPTYRAGESAFAFARFAALLRRHFGARTLLMRRTQVGHQNPEGIEAGSFWFYYKLGFRPVDPRVRRLAEAEATRLAAAKGERTTPPMLRRLARSDLVLSLDGAPPEACREIDLPRLSLAVTRLVERRFGGDRRRALAVLGREAARALDEPRLAAEPVPRMVPIAALVPDLRRWSPEDKRLLAAALLAKEGRREKAYVRAALRAGRLARSLEARFATAGRRPRP